MTKTLVALICASLWACSANLFAAGGTSPHASAIFAGGCFWCMEPPFDKLKGVISTTSGYTGGRTQNPTYQDVTRGDTGHVEVVEVRYDPEIVSYETLLQVYWRNIDPFDLAGQFCDKGESYRPEIFVANDEQKEQAKKSLSVLNASGRFGKPIEVPITQASVFYPAEDYHQDYYQRNPVRYNYYRWGCGRDNRLKSLWKEEAGGKHLSDHYYKSEKQ